MTCLILKSFSASSGRRSSASSSMLMAISSSSLAILNLVFYSCCLYSWPLNYAPKQLGLKKWLILQNQDCHCTLHPRVIERIPLKNGWALATLSDRSETINPRINAKSHKKSENTIHLARQNVKRQTLNAKRWTSWKQMKKFVTELSRKEGQSWLRVSRRRSNNSVENICLPSMNVERV